MITSSLSKHINKNGVKRRNTLGRLDQYMAQHGNIVKQTRLWFCLSQIKYYSSRSPIPLWMCVLHVPLYRDYVKQSLNSIETDKGLFHSLNTHHHNANW